jgi:uncharacterized protein
MSQFQGRFVWHELMTTDTKAARAFYSNVVGWGAEEAPMPGMVYTMFKAGQAHVAGLMDLPEAARKMGAPPNWMGYVAVDDVDASCEKAKGLGASVYVPPTDIPEVGRFCVIADPQGAAIAMFKGASAGPEALAAQDAPGRVGWNELMASDWRKAFDFYQALFGWKKGEAIDMGPMGVYQMFASGDQTLGGMWTKPPTVPAPFWLYYFNVADFDAATERVTAGGGKIVNGPTQVPGGSWIVQARDPQGAMFALVGRRS